MNIHVNEAMPMPRRPWYPKNPSDYIADTPLLSLEAHGVYNLLIDYLWIYDGELPDSYEQLSRLLRADVRRIKRIMSTELSVYFEAENGVIKNKRVTQEIAKAIEKSEKAAKSANARRDANADADVQANAPDEQSGRNANQEPTTNNQDINTETSSPTLWDVWLSTPGVGEPKTARSHLGKLIKTYGEHVVAQAVAVVAVKKPAEPHAFLEGQLKANPKTGKKPDWAMIPFDDEKLVNWAAEHGFSKAKPGETYPQYRGRLRSEVEIRQNQ